MLQWNKAEQHLTMQLKECRHTKEMKYLFSVRDGVPSFNGIVLQFKASPCSLFLWVCVSWLEKLLLMSKRRPHGVADHS